MSRPYPDHELIASLSKKYMADGLKSLTDSEQTDLINHLREAYRQHMTKQTLYDVCNDYSLDSDVSEKSRAAAASNAYYWVEREIHGIKFQLGFSKIHQELHYAKADRADLDGMVIN